MKKVIAFITLGLMLPLMCSASTRNRNHAMTAPAPQQAHSIAKKAVTHISGPELSRYYVKIYQAKNQMPAAKVADKWEMYTNYETTLVKDEVGTWWWVVIYSSDDIKKVNTFVKNFPSIRAKYPGQSAFIPYIYENPNYVSKVTEKPKPSESRPMSNNVIEEKKQTTTPTVTIARIESDVDKGIPVSKVHKDKTFALIFANEEYQEETRVDYALNDGKVFKEYCNKTLGLPEKNIHLVTNATLNNMIGQLDWLQRVCEAYGGEANVIFYYAGHGIPDEASGSAYLLPTDGNSRILRTCFSLSELYKTLGAMPAQKVTVLMDACFSGAHRNGGMLTSARGVAIKAKEDAPQGCMIVLSAAQGDETAYKYEEAKHGLFTYFLLKKLQDTKGKVTMGELSNYIQTQVKRYSIVQNSKSQTPSVMTSNKLRDNWKTMTFD